MILTEILNELKKYKIGTTERSWKMKEQTVSYSNSYLKVVRIDSSNKWVSANVMTKQWGIIFEKYKDISCLPNYLELAKNIDIKITPVTKGENKGCYGIRLYNMKSDPDEVIVKNLLDYIFDE